MKFIIYLFPRWFLLRISHAFYVVQGGFSGGKFNISWNILQKIQEKYCKTEKEDKKDISHKSEACV